MNYVLAIIPFFIWLIVSFTISCFWFYFGANSIKQDEHEMVWILPIFWPIFLCFTPIALLAVGCDELGRHLISKGKDRKLTELEKCKIILRENGIDIE